MQPIVAELSLPAEQHDRVLVDIIEAWRCALGMTGLGWVNELWRAVGLAELRLRIIDADNED